MVSLALHNRPDRSQQPSAHSARSAANRSPTAFLSFPSNYLYFHNIASSSGRPPPVELLPDGIIVAVPTGVQIS
jgi:hypothetical protein